MPAEYARAMNTFDTLTTQFQDRDHINNTGLKPILLTRLVRDQVIDKNAFLRFCSYFIGEELGGASNNNYNLTELSACLSCLNSRSIWAAEIIEALYNGLVNFAKFIIDNLFMPLKALSTKTPNSTPGSACHLLSQEAGIGTPQRLEELRDNCLKRDRHRCVVTRHVCRVEARARFKVDGVRFVDDDGAGLYAERSTMEDLEVAHIFPHSLMSLSKGEQTLSESKQLAHKLLNMFDPSVVPRISGCDIDKPINAITLIERAHTMFGNFEIAFEHLGGHTYKIDYVDPEEIFTNLDLPATRILLLTPDRTKVLHMSAAEEYIDNVLRKMDETYRRQLNANGSTPIDHYIRLKLGFVMS
ncbi:hypothetical protein BDV37DRAFT_297081 [Aspergillus pseudonomiae]|uniref:HNH nuclease domain-containing protein n=1 Tax=Aspergillus pseudonomiae TaxID=1506151 RepID=A0A5N7D372_9EURO|nr:uncharacterized protein BDV37DRAFT_297081 [Aspergillus pseudonomiae]KAE8400278.1 hypothetical protein BDV37DRAFT_297081 [Aspergillus pseudonomiae]